MATLVQSAVLNNTTTDIVALTLGATPIEGNLLIAALGSRQGVGAAAHEISGSGWTKRFELSMEQASGTFRRELSIWTKLAGASEPTGITLDANASAADSTIGGFAAEFALDGGAGEDEWTFLDSISANNGQTANGTSLATGTTPSVSGTQKFVLTVLHMKRGNAATATGCAWSSIDLATAFDAPERSNGVLLSLGYGDSDADGTKASTGTISGYTTNNGLTAAILVFRTQAAAAGGLVIPVAMAQYRQRWN